MPSGTLCGRPGWAEGEPQTTGSETQTTGSEPQTTGSEPQTTGSEPQTTGSEPRTTGSEPRTTGSEPQTTGSEPRTAGSEPQTTGSEPQTTGSQSVRRKRRTATGPPCRYASRRHSLKLGSGIPALSAGDPGPAAIYGTSVGFGIGPGGVVSGLWFLASRPQKGTSMQILF